MRVSLLSFVALAALALEPAFAQHERHGAAPAPQAAKPAGERPGGREWTRLPTLQPATVRGAERGAAALRPAGIDVGRVQVFAADGPPERRAVEYPVGEGVARIEAAAPRVGNYHWVVAREETEGQVRVASTAWYFSNPGASPAELLKQSRHELEIIPAPLPREHGSYRESEKWRFLVRADGAPLPRQALTLETEFGSRSTFLTDADGIATVLFPRDFRPTVSARESEGGHGPRRAKFVLATEWHGPDRRYVTAFNYVYGQDGDRDRSLGWGVFFGVVGMAAAVPLLRRRETNGRKGGVDA